MVAVGLLGACNDAEGDEGYETDGFEEESDMEEDGL